MSPSKPSLKPNNPRFSSGPCPKPPGWTTGLLSGALVGRSHRSEEGRARLRLAIERTKQLLRLPSDFRVAIVPGSDTGAFEMCLWSMLGARGVDVLAWETFGKQWVRDIVDELGLADARVLEAPLGALPDLGAVDFARDVVFAANGTSSGVRVPDFDWIAADRRGLTLVDGTSALFGQAIDWAKVDCLTFSWQKVLGGEAQHGMVILGPRAVERLESYRPAWPLPKLFRMTEGGKLNDALFEGWTINTPSMLAVEDYLAALDWAESCGGLDGLITRTGRNAGILFDWIRRTDWAENLAREEATRSLTSVCLAFSAPRGVDQDLARLQRDMVRLIELEQVAFDIAAYRGAPPGLRIWTGATVESSDLLALTPWLDWAFKVCCRRA